jgi:hypothetical protein
MRWVVDDRVGLPVDFIGAFFKEILGILEAVEDCERDDVESITTGCVFVAGTGEEYPLEVTYIFTKYEITALIERRGVNA